jgi:CheY-like chemotaxis protein
MVALVKTSVLIVEDEPLVALLAEDFVRDLGYHVIGIAPSVENALSMLAKHRPDIALLDYKLGSETSFQVAALCERLGIGVVISTGYAVEDIPEQFATGPLVTKPYSVYELKMALEQAASVIGSRSAHTPGHARQEPTLYTVQGYRNNGDAGPSADASRTQVVARSPEMAAEKVMRERLRRIGNARSLRARVWRLGPDSKPIVTLLYRAQAQEPASNALLERAIPQAKPSSPGLSR